MQMSMLLPWVDCTRAHVSSALAMKEFFWCCLVQTQMQKGFSRVETDMADITLDCPNAPNVRTLHQLADSLQCCLSLAYTAVAAISRAQVKPPAVCVPARSMGCQDADADAVVPMCFRHSGGTARHINVFSGTYLRMFRILSSSMLLKCSHGTPEWIH